MVDLKIEHIDMVTCSLECATHNCVLRAVTYAATTMGGVSPNLVTMNPSDVVMLRANMARYEMPAHGISILDAIVIADAGTKRGEMKAFFLATAAANVKWAVWPKDMAALHSLKRGASSWDEALSGLDATLSMAHLEPSVERIIWRLLVCYPKKFTRSEPSHLFYELVNAAWENDRNQIGAIESECLKSG